jgi:hypothetical protein
MHVALLEVDVAILESEGGDGAVAVEVDVFFEEGREAVVGLDAVEGAVYVFGNFAWREVHEVSIAWLKVSGYYSYATSRLGKALLWLGVAT